jgi:hypothetical protein
MKKKIFLFLILMASAHAHAQIFDAIRGHTQDIKARFSDHQTISGEVVKEGEIDTSAKGQDFLHQSSGTWSVVRVGNDLYLQSSENFSSSPGPDYHVYVSSGAAIKDNDQFDDMQIEVAPLTKPNGAAYYKLATNDIDTVNSVLIWCKQFNEYIGSADLKAKASALN